MLASRGDGSKADRLGGSAFSAFGGLLPSKAVAPPF